MDGSNVNCGGGVIACKETSIFQVTRAKQFALENSAEMTKFKLNYDFCKIL